MGAWSGSKDYPPAPGSLALGCSPPASFALEGFHRLFCCTDKTQRMAAFCCSFKL